jgi:PAS domain S-box-containing protein
MKILQASAAPAAAESEHRRLERLRLLAVLDTGPEPVFEALVRIAAAVCGTPMALISLVDEERQWFKANHGLPGWTETPRAQAFCDHAIRSAGVMEVPDATRDPRFVQIPLVTADPGIRFYAGAPIEMPSGERIGTLCVLDRQPRSLTPQQLETLADLASLTRWALLQRERVQHLAAVGDESQFQAELLASILQNLPCGLSVFDHDLHLVAHNAKFRSLLDFPDHLFQPAQPRFEDFIRHAAVRGDFGPGAIEPTVRRIVDEARQRKPQQGAREHADGTSVYIRREPMPTGGFVTTYVDLTPVRSAERALRASEERQKRALDASRLALWDLDVASDKLYLSDNWSEFLGGPPGPTVLGLQQLLDLVPAEEQQALEGALFAAIRGETDRYAMQHRVRRLDGSWAWIHSEGRVIERDADGQALRAAGTSQDVTARRASAVEAARGAAITRATLEATAEGILVLGPEREVLLHNRQFLRMWSIPGPLEGAALPELSRVVRSQLKDPIGFGQRVDAMYLRLEAGSLDLVELKDGRVFEGFVRPMPLEAGVTGRVWSFRDVTARRAAEEEVRKAKEAAEAANRAKSDFLDNVSHEIRTPLNGVLGLARLLLSEPLTEQQRKYVQLAEGSAASLLELINDLLDLGKIESGRMDLEDQPFRLDELVAQLGDLYRLRADEKGLHFVVDVDARVPKAVSGDAVRLRQILNNLLSNATKFTSQGEVGLVVGRADTGRGSDMLWFTVYDTGIGIPFDVQQRLFTRFTQADPSTARTYGGTGLGLAIVKQLCEMMGGSVLLQSEPGRGSSFRCELPLRPVKLPASPVSAPAPLPAQRQSYPTRVLVAEDNATNQIVVRGLLAQAGYANVTLVNDGQEALDAIVLGEYDLVLMDCRMPRIDGYEASRRLRATGFTAPIIALTANAAAGERERCLAWGMNEYLSKPVDPLRLAQVLAEWTGNLPLIEAPPAPAAATGAVASGESTYLYDRGVALERLGGDAELLAVALGSFRQHGPQVLAAAVAALDAGATADLHRHLHSLAGSAAMVGAQPLHAVARRMEERVGEGALQAAREELPTLQRLMDRFLEESASW